MADISKKIKNKNEILCMKIIQNISAIHINPIKKEIDNNSFKLIYKYANTQLVIDGKNIDNNKTKEVRISYGDYRIDLKKYNCTLKNITDIIITIFRKDNLPRCKKCGSRPIEYYEYKYETQKMETDENSLPVWNVFYIPYISDKEENTENINQTSFVLAKCSCGNQWKLKNISSVHSIYYNYKEAD